VKATSKTKEQLWHENQELQRLLEKTAQGQSLHGETVSLKIRLEEVEGKYQKAMLSNNDLRDAAAVGIRMLSEAIIICTDPTKFRTGDYMILEKAFRNAKNKLQEAITK